MFRLFFIFSFYLIYLSIGYLIYEGYPDISDTEYETMTIVILFTIALHIAFKLVPYWAEKLGNKLSEKYINDRKNKPSKTLAFIVTLFTLFTIIFGLFYMYSNSVNISDEESLKYEKQYMIELQKLKNEISEEHHLIQPSNKKEQCKIYFQGVESILKVFWDGDCKDGYAYGLGREIAKTTSLTIEQIGIYNEGKPGEFCSIKLDNDWQEGTCYYDNSVENYMVRKNVLNNETIYSIGSFGSFDYTKPELFIKKKSSSSYIVYVKDYTSFNYSVYDLVNNQTKKEKYLFRVFNNESKLNGFTFDILKDGNINSSEYVNGNSIRKVNLPNSYILKSSFIIEEVKETVPKAFNAYKKAKIIKEKYKTKICKNSIKVKFMEDKEYKAICKEDEDIFSKELAILEKTIR